MTDEQAAAFSAANLTGGAAIAPGDVLAVIAGLVLGAALLWFAWVLYRAYEAWGRGRMDAFDAGGKLLRATFVLVLVGWLVT